MLQTASENSDGSSKNYKKLWCVFRENGGTECPVYEKKHVLLLVSDQATF